MLQKNARCLRLRLEYSGVSKVQNRHPHKKQNVTKGLVTVRSYRDKRVFCGLRNPNPLDPNRQANPLNPN